MPFTYVVIHTTLQGNVLAKTFIKKTLWLLKLSYMYIKYLVA